MGDGLKGVTGVFKVSKMPEAMVSYGLRPSFASKLALTNPINSSLFGALLFPGKDSSPP